MAPTVRGSRSATTAASRCFGALLFSVFGGAWFILAGIYLHHVSVLWVAFAILILLVLAGGSLRMRSAAQARGPNAYPLEDQRRNGRNFAIVNAVTYAIVFLLFVILPPVHLSNYVFPGFVAVIGLHFFALPPIYRHRANLVTGALMVLWAIVCTILFRANGNQMAGFVALGAALALWVSSAWALRTAATLLSREDL